jgi:hypothetical protein
MSTFLKTALTATLAASVSVTLVGSKLVRAQASPNRSDVSPVESPVSSVTTAPIRSDVRNLADSVLSSFDPEPNEPPKSSGGLGTR